MDAMAGRLYYGDNLDLLRRKIPRDSIDLCYIDPPFNSKRNYNQIYNNVGGEDRAQAQAFIDTWVWNDRAMSGLTELLENASGYFPSSAIELIKGLHKVLGEGSLLAYLVSMTLRIIDIQRVLKPTGSFYLHCDPTANHYLKLVADSVFCSQGGDFKNEIVWRRTGSHAAARRFGRTHDVLLFYTKSAKDYFFNVVRTPYMNGHVDSRYTADASGRLQFTSGGNVLTGSGIRTGESGTPWRGFDPSTKRRHWAVPGFLAEQMPPEFDDLGPIAKLDALFEAGLIEIEEGAAWPQPVRFLRDGDGNPLGDIWAAQPYTEGTVYGTRTVIDADVQWLGPTDPECLGYPTQKPLGLLSRIIRSSCPEGGTVLDAYCGCGTTIAAAHHLKRNWIGMDITFQSIALILKRLADSFGKTTADAVVLDGVPRDMDSATALAHKNDDRVRKEFEKWAVLTYTNNRAGINEKKGADGGIDGTVYFMTGPISNATMVLQAKSGSVGRGDVAKLHGDMTRAGAALATLITLDSPTSPMLSEAKAAGRYYHEVMGRWYDKIQIVTVQE
jgi:DNA modification methylase